jgi:hypothetical protein
MAEMIIITLVLLQIKHWYIDFVDQSMEEVHSKGKYGQWLGIRHSLKHGVATSLIVLLIVGFAYLPFVLICGMFDFFIHYHTDWAKMNYGNRDITTPAFWNHLGLDQMVHQITYLIVAYMMT